MIFYSLHVLQLICYTDVKKKKKKPLKSQIVLATLTYVLRNLDLNFQAKIV